MKQRSGVYQSDFRLSNGERIRKSLGTTDKTEAQLKEKALHVRMEEALKKAPRDTTGAFSLAVRGMTFKAAFSRTSREYEPWRTSRSPKTIADNYAHVTAHFGELKDLAEVTRKDLMEYTQQLRKDGMSASTINQRLSLISVLMKQAENWTDGIVVSMKMPRQKSRRGRIRTLSRDEEENVLNWYRNYSGARERCPDMLDLVVFLIDTGFRLGEALQLHSRDINWDERMVPAWETKGDAPRLVPMTERVIKILEARKGKKQPFGMFSKDSADDHWEAMRKGLKIDTEEDPEFVIHALRHTCASRLAAKGEDAFRIQKWMGHKSVTTTLLYVTLFAADLKPLAETLNKANNAASGVPKSVPKQEQKQQGMRSKRSPSKTAQTQLPLGF